VQCMEYRDWVCVETSRDFVAVCWLAHWFNSRETWGSIGSIITDLEVTDNGKCIDIMGDISI